MSFLRLGVPKQTSTGFRPVSAGTYWGRIVPIPSALLKGLAGPTLRATGTRTYSTEDASSYLQVTVNPSGSLTIWNKNTGMHTFIGADCVKNGCRKDQTAFAAAEVGVKPWSFAKSTFSEVVKRAGITLNPTPTAYACGASAGGGTHSALSTASTTGC